MDADRPPTNPPRLSMGLLVVGSEMVSFTVAGLILDYALNSMPVGTVVLTDFMFASSLALSSLSQKSLYRTSSFQSIFFKEGRITAGHGT